MSSPVWTRTALLAWCAAHGIKGCSKKTKAELLLLQTDMENREKADKAVEAIEVVPRRKRPVYRPKKAEVVEVAEVAVEEKKVAVEEKEEKKEVVYRLNYIGSKYPLLDWLTSVFQEKTGWGREEWHQKTVADLFAGTGIVSYHFRRLGARVISNDVELYSSIITQAFTRSVWNDTVRHWIQTLQQEIEEGKHLETGGVGVGYITRHYSPFEGNERRFFTIDNAQRIDYLRERLLGLSTCLSEDDACFLLACLLLAADAVSNVPAVYGCFLKEFKAKATKPLVLLPLHTCTTVSHGVTTRSDVLSSGIRWEADVVYLDPPYNQRQYSKNYFPLNMIAKTPAQTAEALPLTGKTGIPTDCFLSPFCQKKEVERAFDVLFRSCRAQWLFLSYNSESLVSKERLLDLMGKYGEVSVVERDYKRFKSFEYNQDKAIQEYLFCLRFSSASSSAPLAPSESLESAPLAP